MPTTARFSYAYNHHNTLRLLERLCQLRDSPVSFERKKYDKIVNLLQMQDFAQILSAKDIAHRSFLQNLILQAYNLFRGHAPHSHRHEAEVEPTYVALPNSKAEDVIDQLPAFIADSYEASQDYIQKNATVVFEYIMSDSNISDDYKQKLLAIADEMLAELAKATPDIAVLDAAPVGLRLALLGEARVDGELLTPRRAIRHFGLGIEDEIDKACDDFCKRHLPADLREQDANIYRLRPRPASSIQIDEEAEETKLLSHEEILKKEVRKHMVGGILIRKDIPEQDRTTADRNMDSKARYRDVVDQFQAADSTSQLVTGLLAILESAKELNQLSLKAEQHAAELTASLGRARPLPRPNPFARNR